MLCISFAVGKPTMIQLLSMTDKNGDNIHILEEIAPVWELIAIPLKIPDRHVRIIAKDHKCDSIGGCHKMLTLWIEENQCVTWECLINALNTVNHQYLAQRIELTVEC